MREGSELAGCEGCGGGGCGSGGGGDGGVCVGGAHLVPVQGCGPMPAVVVLCGLP